VEAQFSTIIYEAFQNAVKNPNPLQVIIISFSFFQIHCMLQLTNLVQVITECHSCSANAVLRACARQSAPSRPRTHFRSAPEFCPRPETRPVHAPCVARARSCPRPCPFPLAPVVVPVGAWHASVDTHLRLLTATSAGNSKKSYYSKVNLEQ
jgi:hypothetical protein